MANIRSQIKRNRQNEQRRLRNKSTRSALRTRVKRFESAVSSGDGDTARDEYRAVSKAFDQAAAKGIVHRNRAAGAKSRLARRLRALG